MSNGYVDPSTLGPNWTEVYRNTVGAAGEWPTGTKQAPAEENPWKQRALQAEAAFEHVLDQRDEIAVQRNTWKKVFARVTASAGVNLTPEQLLQIFNEEKLQVYPVIDEFRAGQKNGPLPKQKEKSL